MAEITFKSIQQLDEVLSADTASIPIQVLGSTKANKITSTNFLKDFAPKNSPSLTGNPKAATAPPGLNNNQLATTGFVQQELNSLQASRIIFSPTNGVLATTTQNAIAELASGKANILNTVLTGIPTTPTPTSENNTLQIANTSFVNNAITAKIPVIASPTDSGRVKVNSVDADPIVYLKSEIDARFIQSKQIKQILHNTLTTSVSITNSASDSVIHSLIFTPQSALSLIIIDCIVNGCCILGSSQNYGKISFGWNGVSNSVISDYVGYTNSGDTISGIGSVIGKMNFFANHDGLGIAQRTYNILGKLNVSGGSLTVNNGSGATSIMITEIII